ncbi:MAG: hypothetical protein EGR83_10195 [Bacteroides cellulosilyticus]|uniref:hypothetical protein n=1 Tax=Bacteroides cellulosilyticus TaxID=246787 RepID=UPI001D4C178D|nr:hypothetical protein [Bacteroides cellulosilyticus]
MSEITLKPKITLRKKSDSATFSFNERVIVTLLWSSETDLDLCLFFKKKNGEVGGVFSDEYRQNRDDLGALNKFPFIMHSGDAKEPQPGGEESEEIKIAKLDDIAEAYVVIVNYGAAIDNEPVTFNEHSGKVILKSDTGDNLEVLADASDKGHVYLVCSIKNDGASKTLKNEKEVMDLGAAFSRIPGFKLICN